MTHDGAITVYFRQRTRLGTVATGGRTVKSEDMPLVRQVTQTQAAAPPSELLEAGHAKSIEGVAASTPT
ncbi:hypothetical protein Pmar_PMAR008004, partial [Perkinsus marinus ATCC 50983]